MVKAKDDVVGCCGFEAGEMTANPSAKDGKEGMRSITTAATELKDRLNMIMVAFSLISDLHQQSAWQQLASRSRCDDGNAE